jgi:hypothetical protein
VNIEVVADPRRWAAFHCYGGYSLLIDVHGSAEDMQGALAGGQLEVAAFAGREVVLACCRIEALLGTGLPPDRGNVFGDPFAGLAPDRVERACSLINAIAAAIDADEAAQAAAPIVAMVDEVTRALGFAEPPPPVRHPSGLMPALRMARELLPINKDAHLPLALPKEWVNAAK